MRLMEKYLNNNGGMIIKKIGKVAGTIVMSTLIGLLIGELVARGIDALAFAWGRFTGIGFYGIPNTERWEWYEEVKLAFWVGGAIFFGIIVGALSVQGDQKIGRKK